MQGGVARNALAAPVRANNARPYFERSKPASTATLSAGAGAVILAAVSAGRASRRSLQARQKKVVVFDGSTWGSMDGKASTSLDTSEVLPFVRLKRGSNEATVYLLGACVTSYKTNGIEWLAVRPDAKFDGSKPISGGLPFCFPQFGPGEMQQHGFARNLEWKLLEEPSEAGKCVLELTDNDETRKMWPHAFRCEYTVELQEDQLATMFKVQNTSASDFSFSAALHSYYGVSKVDDCKITGSFEGATKLDKTTTPPSIGRGKSNTIAISKFTEEIYKEVLPGTVVLGDPTKGDLEIVSSGGWRDVVIWSPYGDMKMGADRFVCVESAELASIPLAPKGVWEAHMNLVPKPKA